MGRHTKLEQVVKSMIPVMNVPLTLKMRTGIYGDKSIAHQLVPKLRDWGISMVTVRDILLLFVQRMNAIRGRSVLVKVFQFSGINVYCVRFTIKPRKTNQVSSPSLYFCQDTFKEQVESFQRTPI